MTSKLNRIPFLPALFFASLAALGCASTTEKEHEGARSVEIKVVEYKFTPNTITAHSEEPLDIELDNEGKFEHSIEFDVPGAKPALEQPVPPGKTAHLAIVAPREPGTYTFFSPVGDDRTKGLTGKLLVTSLPSKH